MNKISQYLQQHVSGEVVTAADARRYFSTDASIFTVAPSLIIYPRNESDIRKSARFAWQLAERGRVIPITARGSGTDQCGAAIGSGMIMVFPAHMNRIIELDSKSGVVTVEPGINFGKLQQTLETHGRFLPPYPASFEYSTIGGAVGNNAAGEKSVKYGSIGSYIQRMRVVLANGEVIETGKLSKRDLSKKLGLVTFEGEVYRAVDALLEESKEVVDQLARDVTKNAAGYNLADVKSKDGSIDLTPLFVGSQGTLGIVSEVTLETELYNAETVLVIATFNDIESMQSAINVLRGGRDLPSAIEMVDENLLQFVATQYPSLLHNVVSTPLPKFMLFIEYDNSGRSQKRASKHGAKVLAAYAQQVDTINDIADQEAYWRVRHATALVTAHANGGAKALPLVEDCAVPVVKLGEFLHGIYEIFSKNHLSTAVWGHAGDANLHVQPYLDLSQIGDRQKAFRLLDEYYKMVVNLGGTITAEHGDGRLKGPFLEQMYGAEAYEVFRKIKKIFDPYGILNPGVKINVSLEDIKPLLRQEYTLHHLYEHLPRN